ncbi:MAG: hypothetical protein KF832_09670 [Caldilineaceae bacterium]|nr:hypothetical protein [Caldilineaceae bacterium]
MAAVVVWQAHVTTLYLAALLIQNPALRPSGWSSATLVGLSKLSVLGWGTLWLMGTSYLEYQLRTSVLEHRLLQQTGRCLLILVGCFGIVYLPTLF